MVSTNNFIFKLFLLFTPIKNLDKIKLNKMSFANSMESSFDEFSFNEKLRKVNERPSFRNSRKLRKNEQKIIKIRIDISCPNTKNYLDQLEKGLSLRKILIEIDRRDIKLDKSFSDQDFDDMSSNIEYKNVLIKPEYSLDLSIPRSKTDFNLIKVLQNDLSKKRSSLQHDQYSAFLNYPKELLPSQKWLFNSKRTIRYNNSFASNMKQKSEDSVLEVVYYDHETYNEKMNHIQSKRLINSKISIGISRDPEGISSLKTKSTENQHLVKTKLIIFDFKKMEEINSMQNPTTLFTFFKHPYAKICELNFNNLMLSEIDSNKQCLPNKFELSKGNSKREIGIDLSGNIKYESFQTYCPLHIKFKDIDLSNDEIIDLINQKLTEKMQNLNKDLISYINSKFPLDFVYYNAGKKSPSTKDLTMKTDEPQFYLLSYQVLDEKFEPLEDDLIQFVNINYSILNGTDNESIKEAIYSAIGHKTEAYSCNFFRMWHYIILIRQPRIDLNPMLKNKIFMKDFELVKYDDSPENDTDPIVTTLYFQSADKSQINESTKIDQNFNNSFLDEDD